MHYKKMIALCFCILVTGCSHVYGDKGVVKNRDADYLKARSIPPLKIPAGLSTKTFETHYPAPQNNDAQNLKDVNLTPPGI